MGFVRSWAVVVAGAALLRSAHADGPANEPSALAEKDAAIVKRVAAVLPPGDRAVADVVKALDASEPPEGFDLGYGLKRTECSLFGESLTAWVRVVAWDGKVAALSVRLSHFEYDDKPLEAFRAGGFDVSKAVKVDDKALVWKDETRMTAARAAIAKGVGLGAPAKTQPTVEAASALAVLDDPFGRLVYGESCNEDGAPPRGREALETLVKAKAVEVLRSALTAPTPEGRVYAAEGLLRLARDGTALAPDVKAAVEVVRTSPLALESCGGCIHTREEKAEALLAKRLADR
jgi:hypothetical protein